MDQHNLVNDMIESSEAFKDQFNPDSENYHKGLHVPVPVGGQRVPESMPTVYPEQVKDLGAYIQGEQQKQDYGPEYEKIQKQREFFNGVFKKTLQKVSMQVEAIFRHQDNFKKLNDPTNEAKLSVHQKNMEKDTKILKDALSELQEHLAELNSQPQYKDRYAEVYKIIENAQGEHNNKEQVADMNFAVKRVTALAFKDSQLMLDQLKQIKKQKDQQQPQQQLQTQQLEESKQA